SSSDVTSGANVSRLNNDSLFVTKSVTNSLLDSASTNALLASATTNLFLTTNATVTASTGLLGGGKLSNTLSIDASLVVTSGANVSRLNNDSLFVTKSVTNGLLDSSSTNALLASATTNLFLTTNATVTASTGLLGGGKLSNTLSIDASLVVTSGANVSRLNNDSLFVTQSVTNGLLDSSPTNGLATANYVAAQGYVTAIVTNSLATTNQNVSLFTNDANYVTATVTNGLPDLNTLVGKAATNLFSGSNTGLVASAGTPDSSKFLRQDGSWTAPSGATNGFVSLLDLNSTNAALRTGSQAVTNGLPDATTLAGKAATNQNISLFPNNANYVTA